MYETNAKAKGNYQQKRTLTEIGLFRKHQPFLRQVLKHNIYARPRYGTFYLLDRRNPITPTTYYGSSFLVLRDITKLNALYNPYDSMDAKYNHGKDLHPCTYDHLDLLLLQCQDSLLSALLQRVTTGTLPQDFSQQYEGSNLSANGYIEVMLPAIDFFDPLLVSHIHINRNEYDLPQSEMDLIPKDIMVTKSVVNPYPQLCKNFMEYIESNNIEQVRRTLKLFPSLAYITNTPGLEPIHIAAKKGYIDIVKLLLPYYYNINKLSPDGKSLLHFAIESGKIELVNLLLEQPGIDLNIRLDNKNNISNGATPVFWACSCHKSTDIVKLLIKKGADPRIGTRNGQTPLTVATWHNKDDLLKVLLETNCRDTINGVVSPGGDTALTNVVEKCDPSTLTVMLSVENINVNYKKKNGESALFIAAKQGNKEKVALLLQMPGVDVDAKRIPGDGCTALEIAKQNNHVAVASLIENKIKPMQEIQQFQKGIEKLIQYKSSYHLFLRPNDTNRRVLKEFLNQIKNAIATNQSTSLDDIIKRWKDQVMVEKYTKDVNGKVIKKTPYTNYQVITEHRNIFFKKKNTPTATSKAFDDLVNRYKHVRISP